VHHIKNNVDIERKIVPFMITYTNVSTKVDPYLQNYKVTGN